MGYGCYENPYHNHNCKGSLAKYTHRKNGGWGCGSLFNKCYGYTPYPFWSHGCHGHHCHETSFWKSFGLGFLGGTVSWLMGTLCRRNSGGASGVASYDYNNGYNLGGVNNIPAINYSAYTPTFGIRNSQSTSSNETTSSNPATTPDANSTTATTTASSTASSNASTSGSTATPDANNTTATTTASSTASSDAANNPNSKTPSGYYDIDNAILTAVNSLTYTNEQGYTDANEDELSGLNADNVEFARDVEGNKKSGSEKIKDISGTVTVEDNGKTIKINDSVLGREITYKCIGKTTNGKMIYVDTTSNSKQVYILQKNTSGEYALMQYGEMDGSVVVAQSK